MTDPANRSYYQVSFTGVQALVGLVALLAALALAFFLGAKAGFEKSTSAGAQPSVVPPGESESPASVPAVPTSTTIEGPAPAQSASAAAPGTAAATSSAPAPPLAPQEAPVFEDREAGVGAEQAPSRTEIAGETSRTPAAPSPKAPPKTPPRRAAAEKEETSPAAAAAAKTASGYYVQILSTTSKSEATRWKERLSAKKYRPALSAVDSSKGKMYRVRLGPYADKEQAKKLAAKISAEFHREAWVARAQ
jgi:cell division protein FtsN